MANKEQDAILNAIEILIHSNSKKDPYDKTFIGRISAINGNNKYSVVINGRTYENIKGLPFLNYNKNDIVYCLAPQGNLNQLRILMCINNETLNIKNALINTNGVETIIDKSLTANGYIKYSSGLIIQWGSASIGQDLRSVQMNLNISFTDTNYVVFLQLGTPTNINQYMNGSGIDTKNVSSFVYTTECYANNMNWIAIGY